MKWYAANEPITQYIPVRIVFTIHGAFLARDSNKYDGRNKRCISNAFSNISRIIRSVGSGFSGVSYSTRSGGASRIASLTPYAIHPAIAKLSNIEIPQLATGAVLPANREFLALVGDQKHGTNVEAPLDTIKQALREEAISLGLIGKNETPEINLNLTVECAGYQLLNIIQKLDSEHFKQTGRHVLA